MDVHVAMLNGCMGSRVKQDLLLARTCAFHTELCKYFLCIFFVNATQGQLKKNEY